MILREEPQKLPVRRKLPDVFAFMDGGVVDTPEDWAQRASEIRELYEYYMYGPLPEGEADQVSCTITDWREVDEEKKNFDGSLIHARARVCNLEIQVSCNGTTSSIRAIVTLPVEQPVGSGYPVYIEMSFVFGNMSFEPSANAFYAAQRGYATINWLPAEVAADNGSRSGCFYTLHPYGKNWREQTGVLAAWGWGASRILDALEQKKAQELQIDWEKNILAGVSRYGKATLVAGAYDRRFRVVVPACSGAGGVAMYRCLTEGNKYDLSELGYRNEEGTGIHLTTTNEPLGSLQSPDERHWFNDRFGQFDCVERFPMDQHHLASLIAEPDRYLFIIASAFGEDWTNPAAMFETYRETKKLYEFLGIPDNVCIDIHLQGHAVLLSDMQKLLDYCDVKLLGRTWEEMNTSPEELQRDHYFPQIQESVF